MGEKMSMAEPFLVQQIEESIAVKQRLLQDAEWMAQLQQACAMLLAVYRAGGKLLIAGNGGSAADAQHIAGELVSRFYFDRPALPAIALTTDSSIMTAIGNDYGYERLFSRQIEGNGKAGDLLLAISTSGNSPNILHAIQTARRLGITVLGLTGASGGQMAELCHLCLRIPSTQTPRIQESHLLVGHLLCASVEQGLFGQQESRIT
ncbi:D-sedoheptulose 7-phosphate isomerase [Candidatus Magnetaquicoccus inordinatus]|uniref:D-sedoheptulose-7-phosphate isomerase n=1 Tax=Candidatus Magnetaquicoccus inordinatus TaxID=2496818 RepID=UPI002A4E15D6|nr:D-sedoheptulose 7-phosphate isomerase [Candidatus Magnetaquicoccus inordinatus]